MRWRYAAASVAGTSHLRDDRPGQDAHYCSVAESITGPVLVAIVSDGAGSASHGGEGSTFVCADLASRLETSLPLQAEGLESAAWLRDCVDQTRTALLVEANSAELAARQFAATLACAVLTEQWSAFAQIGDGAIVAPEPGTQDWNWLFWPQRGEYANSTSFVTDVAAMDSLQVESMSESLEEVALFTDGLQHLVLDYANSTVHSPFFERMLGPVRGSEASGQDVTLSSGLAEYLRGPTVTGRADDDLTLVMATRRGYE